MNVVIGTPTNTTISLSWKEPNQTNGIITNYTVQWASFSDSNVSSELVGAEVFDYTIENLTPYTNYSVEVFASTSAGRGASVQLVVPTDTGCKSRVSIGNEECLGRGIALCILRQWCLGSLYLLQILD